MFPVKHSAEDLAAAVELVAVERGTVCLSEAARLAGATPGALGSRLPKILPLLTEKARGIVREWMAARGRRESQEEADARLHGDDDILAAVQLAYETTGGKLDLKRAGALARADWRVVARRLPRLLPRLEGRLLDLAEEWVRRNDPEADGIPDFEGPARDPEPTPHGPGDPDKVAEMARRAERGEALFHPLDGLKPAQDRAPPAPEVEGADWRRGPKLARRRRAKAARRGPPGPGPREGASPCFRAGGGDV